MLVHRKQVEEILEGKSLDILPVSVEVDPSNKCNHDCGFCAYSSRRAANNVHLSEEILMQLVEDVGEKGVKGMLFTGGGEPLVNPFTVSAMERANELGVDTGLITNGGMITDKNLTTIVNSTRFVRLSLDAGTTESHRIMHEPKNGVKRDEFRYILDRIRDMVTHRDAEGLETTIGIGFLVNPTTLHEVYDGCKEAHFAGANYIQIRPIYDLPQTQQTIVREQAPNLVRKQIERFKGEFKDSALKVHAHFPRFADLYANHKDYARCESHPLIGVVGATGELYLCCQHKGTAQFSYGQITQERRFFDIWEDKVVRSGVAESIQLGLCPPCKYNDMNRLLDQMKGEGSEQRAAHFESLKKGTIQHPNNL
tara:strand:- start:13120 stop:14220 length:1101 start_codon:yes stop_codon:yes gene_type:complete